MKLILTNKVTNRTDEWVITIQRETSMRMRSNRKLYLSAEQREIFNFMIRHRLTWTEGAYFLFQINYPD